MKEKTKQLLYNAIEDLLRKGQEPEIERDLLDILNKKDIVEKIRQHRYKKTIVCDVMKDNEKIIIGF